MTQSLASHAAALSALGHDARLAVFRLLVKAGNSGLNVGQLVAATDLPASTLAHHLRALVAAGLVIQERDGRETINRVDYAAVHRTVDFLTSECCTGVALVAKEQAA